MSAFITGFVLGVVIVAGLAATWLALARGDGRES